MPRGKKTLSVHFTDLCNNDCVFCVVGIPQRSQELDAAAEERITRAIREGKDQGFEVVNVHGGEPTVSPRLLPALEMIRDCGYPEVHLQTNGRRLEDVRFVRRLRELNVTIFIVSMHGRCAETHDGLTGAPGGFAQTVRGIVNVKEAGGIVQTNTVVTRPNLGEVEAMVDWLAELGVDCLNVSNLHPAGTALLHFEALTPTVRELQLHLPPVLRKALDRRIRVTLEGFPPCFLPGLEAHHLARHDGIISVEIRGAWIDDYERWMDEVQKVKDGQCGECAAAASCGGVYKEYVERRGWSEIRACCAPLTAVPS